MLAIFRHATLLSLCPRDRSRLSCSVCSFCLRIKTLWDVSSESSPESVFKSTFFCDLRNFVGRYLFLVASNFLVSSLCGLLHVLTVVLVHINILPFPIHAPSRVDPLVPSAEHTLVYTFGVGITVALDPALCHMQEHAHTVTIPLQVQEWAVFNIRVFSLADVAHSLASFLCRLKGPRQFSNTFLQSWIS